MKKFTFKNSETPKGLARIGHKKSVKIKLNGVWVGTIESEYKIRLMVVKSDINEDGNSNCSWKWVQFKNQFDSFEQAKTWLNKNREHLFNNYNIRKD